jgi:integrase
VAENGANNGVPEKPQVRSRLAGGGESHSNPRSPFEGGQLSPDHTARSKRDYAMLAMLLCCGLRRSELVALELDDIQLRATGLLWT